MIYEVYVRLPVQSASLLIDVNLVLVAQMVLDGGERRPQPLLLSDDRIDNHLPVQASQRLPSYWEQLPLNSYWHSMPSSSQVQHWGPGQLLLRDWLELHSFSGCMMQQFDIAEWSKRWHPVSYITLIFLTNILGEMGQWEKSCPAEAEDNWAGLNSSAKIILSMERP